MESDSSATAAGGAQTAHPSAPAGECTNCQTPFGAEDEICESCGYDFATGTLPGADATEQPVSAPVSSPPATPSPAAKPDVPAPSPAPSRPTPAPAAEPLAASEPIATSDATPTQGAPSATPSATTELVAVIECDRSYFDEIVGEADLSYPDPEPAATTVALSGGKILIGRHNQSRGVYPEIDIDACTGDPAASTRHAMLRRNSDNAWTINDLGSTNGTMLTNDPADSSASRALLTAGVEVVVTEGSMIFLGAFTRVTLQAAT